jgi:hypothetical protein
MNRVVTIIGNALIVVGVVGLGLAAVQNWLGGVPEPEASPIITTLRSTAQPRSVRPAVVQRPAIVEPAIVAEAEAEDLSTPDIAALDVDVDEAPPAIASIDVAPRALPSQAVASRSAPARNTAARGVSPSAPAFAAPVAATNAGSSAIEIAPIDQADAPVAESLQEIAANDSLDADPDVLAASLNGFDAEDEALEDDASPGVMVTAAGAIGSGMGTGLLLDEPNRGRGEASAVLPSWRAVFTDNTSPER